MLTLSPYVGMQRRNLVLAIALVIAIPILFASLGASRDAGLIIGVVLVVIGVGSSVLGSRRQEDDG